MRSASPIVVLASATVLGLVALARTSFAGRPDAGARELAARIDAELEREWKEAGISPAPLAPDLAFYRRASLDLLGTLPSLAEIRDFESERSAKADGEEGRRERLLSRLFEDPRFDDALAERLARIVVGASKKPDDLFYRRRRFVEWLRGEVAKRRPWDDLVRELLAAEGTSTGAPAVNFVIAADADPVKLAGRTARAFLGVRLDCAQCHDAPFSHWKQREFEELSAFFARTRRGGRGPVVYEATSGDYELHDRKDGTPRVVPPRFPASFDAKTEPGDALARSTNLRRELGRCVTDRANPFFARSIANRIWAWLMGTGLVEPVDELDTVKTFPPLLELLARDLEENGFDLVRLVRAIASSRAYSLASSLPAERAGEDQERLIAARALFPLKPLHPDQLAAALWQATSFWPQTEERALVLRLAKVDQTGKFIQRHGGNLDAEAPEDPTLLQRVLLMNGQLVEERIKADNPFGVTSRLVGLAPTDERIVETAYLMALARRPSGPEMTHFLARLSSGKKADRAKAAADLLWALLNSVEFSFNH